MFLKEHEDVQRAAEKSLAAAIDSTHVIAWLREFFGLTVGQSYTAIPGLLCGPANHGQSVRLADGTLEVWPVIGADTWDAAQFPVYGRGHVGTVVHEFTHAFSNRLSSALAPQWTIVRTDLPVSPTS